MPNPSRLITRRELLKSVPLGVAGTILLNPTEAEARWVIGLLFRVASVGFGTVLGAVGLGATLLGAGIAAAARGSYSSYSGYAYSGGGSSGGGYTTHAPRDWKSYEPPKPIVITVSLKPNDQIKGDVLRILAIEHDLLKNDGIVLPRGGRLIIEEDGTMQFADTSFRGHAHMHNNRDFFVFTPDHQLVLTRVPRDKQFHNFHHDSTEGRVALTSLLGEVRHA